LRHAAPAHPSPGNTASASLIHPAAARRRCGTAALRAGATAGLLGRTSLRRVASGAFISYSPKGTPRQTKLPPPNGDYSCGPNFRPWKPSRLSPSRPEAPIRDP
jgi:hypothetical protein